MNLGIKIRLSGVQVPPPLPIKLIKNNIIQYMNSNNVKFVKLLL